MLIMHVLRYQLLAGDSSSSDGDYYDTREAAIFIAVSNASTSGNSGGQGSSEGQGSSGEGSQRASERDDTGGEDQRSDGGCVAKAEGGVASLEDLYGASTDDESDNEGMYMWGCGWLNSMSKC